jgi:ABC-type glycerol-3-phosphate transport system substrate-binding protein
MKTKATLAALSAAALLAACGGGDHNSPPATSEVPASASTSVDGFIDYLKKLVASSADMLEPVDTAAVTGPTDETSEPQKVD